MKLTGLRTLVTCAFALALALMIMIGLFSYRSTVLLVKSGESRQRSNAVQKDFQRLLAELRDAEAGQRGYLITGEEHYLEPYFSALAGLDPTVKEVRTLSAGDVEEQESLDALEPLIARKLAELKQTVDLRRERGFDAAQAVVLTDRGLTTMEQIRTILN
ncbi:MAG TPA: CHASE3 domain-containing protein [Terriglobia bacterium]|nr:CHASE3 domain-containing protein [Terriglobia bacterium]